VAAPENLIIDTPEQIPIELPLANIGSRFLAIAFDTLLQTVAVGLIVGVAAAIRWFGSSAAPALSNWVTAALTLGTFAIYAAYFAFFESIWNGQTPGKRLVGLRVIDASGRPISVYAALVRNILRIVDSIPGIYAVAIISAIVTRRNQRLGDLAAGTLVIRERAEAIAPSAPAEASAARHGAHRLASGDIVLIEGFLRRRAELDSWVRLQSARKIAARMASKLELGAIEDEERFLEQLAAEYRSADRYR
jgi:uncharacterized RDD family membrane protein YckC